MVQFTEGQWEDAREQARFQGMSLSSFVRYAVDERLARSESLRSGVRRRALAAIDGLELHDQSWRMHRDRGCGRERSSPPGSRDAPRSSDAGREEAAGVGGESPDKSPDSAGVRAIPKYMLDLEP